MTHRESLTYDNLNKKSANEHDLVIIECLKFNATFQSYFIYWS